MEDVFGKYKKSKEMMPKELIESLLESVDFLSVLAGATPQERVAHKAKAREYVRKMTNLLERTEGSEETRETQTLEFLETIEAVEKKPPQTEDAPKVNADLKTIRVPVEKLNAIMRQSEEMLFAKIVSQRHVLGVEKILKKLQSDSSLDPQELKSMLLKEIAKSKSDERLVYSMVDNLLEEMKKALMLPFSSLFFTLPKSVHDMATSLGKEVTLKVEGGEIEIDRRILEEMKDPLTHLLRNALDHGIESPQMREKREKPKKGLITISLKRENSSKVSITVRDDGEGIDVKKLLASALKDGVIEKDEYARMSSENLLSLIFRSGVTTREIVSDFSGRGLGLAIVKEKTQRLGGDVSVRNLEGGGCEFTIVAPLTLSTFRGVLVAVDEHRLVFPSVSVERVMEIASR